MHSNFFGEVLQFCASLIFGNADKLVNKFNVLIRGMRIRLNKKDFTTVMLQAVFLRL